MMVFTALCVAMVILALGFVFWPSFRLSQDAGIDRQGLVLDLFNEHLASLDQQKARGEIDEQQYHQLTRELEQSLLEDAPQDNGSTGKGGISLLIATGLAMPVVALAFYWSYGSIEDVEIVEIRDLYFQQGALAAQSGDSSTPVALQSLVESLEARIKHKPNNTGNRYLLARSYMQQSLYMKAAAQYIELIQLEEALSAESGEPRVPANIVGELAQAVFLAAGNQVTPEVKQLTEKALALDPNETTSLGLAGIGAFEQADYAGALRYWGRAVQLLGPASNAAMSLRAGMARAQQLMSEVGVGTGGVNVANTKGDPDDDTAGSAAQVVSLQVSVSLSSLVNAAPTDTVFIYARAWQGAKVPLAIARLKVSDLPTSVTLDESMAMAPGMTLTSVSQLEIVARISAVGDPMAKPGDWQASAGPVMLAEALEPVVLVVQAQLP